MPLTSFSPQLLLAVALGGALGAMLRYVVSVWSVERFGVGFPWGTLTVNLVGAFLIGLLVGWLQAPVTSAVGTTIWRPLLVVGLLGSLTTFSTFSLEMLTFLQQGEWGLAAVYLVLSVVGAIGLTFLGLSLAAS